MDLLQQIFNLCLVPLLMALSAFLIQWINAERENLKAKTESEVGKKYTDMIADTITRCVTTTTQTYVDSLKGKNAFTKEAQSEAFNRSMNAIMAALTDDAKSYITETFGDLEAYLTTAIEHAVWVNK